ncbi:BatD family protein [Kiritimatiellota bacterium B12222]|nr:BatD family protein [Kiritimatiellota bacterium B12222]
MNVKVYRPLLIFVFLFANLLRAEVHMDLSKSSISVDDTVELILSYKDNGFPRPPSLPLPDGLRELGNSNQQITINGHTEYTVRYILKASAPGSYTIGPYKLKTTQGDQNLDAITLTVTPAKVLEADENLFVTLESSSSEVLVRETIELTLSFYTRINIGNINLIESPREGYELSDWREIQSGTRNIQGKNYRVNQFLARLTPTKTGTIELNPIFNVSVIQRGSSYDALFGNRSSENVRVQLPEPLKIKVNAPPTEGQPEDYSGHLGDFSLNASASPREVNVGDPITLRVELSGRGSLQQALPPGLKESENFKVYQPRLINEEMRNDGLSGRKIIEQVIIPKHAGVSKIPSLEFSYYDTETKKYKTIQTPPFAITVTGENKEETPSTFSSLNFSPEPLETELLGDDLLYLKTQPTPTHTLKQLQPGWTLIGLSGLPFLTWAFSGLLMRKREQSVKDPHAQRRQQAPKRLRKHLAKLDHADDDIYRVIWEILSEYLSARLSLPPGELNLSDVSEKLPTTVNTAQKQALENWMQRCDLARFAGTSSTETQADTRKEFRGFILKLDRELGR